MKLRPRLLLLLVLVAAIGLLAWWTRRDAAAPTANPSPPITRVAPQLINAWDTAVLLAPDGSLWAWGGSQFQLNGLLAKPTTTQIPVRISSDTDWRAVAANHICVIAQKADGSLWGWGGNGSGQLAQPIRGNITTPRRIGTETNWSQISAGMGHMLALKGDGTLWAWGQNDHGQVGDGTKVNQSVVTQIGEEGDWRTIAAGAFNSCALKTDGTLWGWGLDPISGGGADVLSPKQMDSSTNWSSISAGDYCYLGLKTDGTLWVWGQNAHSVLPSKLTSSAGTPTQVDTNTDWAEVHAGQSYFFARKQDGSWWVCGQNSESQMGVVVGLTTGSPKKLPTPMAPWVLSPGFGNTTWLNHDGTLWSLGTALGSASVDRGLLASAKNVINRIFGPLLKRPLFRSRDATQDFVPRMIWQLPDEMRQRPGEEMTNGIHSIPQTKASPPN